MHRNIAQNQNEGLQPPKPCLGALLQACNHKLNSTTNFVTTNFETTGLANEVGLKNRYTKSVTTITKLSVL